MGQTKKNKYLTLPNLNLPKLAKPNQTLTNFAYPDLN